ncbi:hypothetical protein DSUL_100168 [Desulfovibrionales bacterium]
MGFAHEITTARQTKIQLAHIKRLIRSILITNYGFTLPKSPMDAQ